MYGEQFTNPFFGGFAMKRLIGISLMLALALMLMPVNTVVAHHDTLGDPTGIWRFDPDDPDPDTNWQPYVVDTTKVNLLNAQGGNLGAGSGNVLWVQNNHQGDAKIDRHRNDNFGRDAFLKFDTAAKTGDVLTGSFRTNNVGAQNGWVLTSDIEAMLDDTSDVGPPSDGSFRGPAKHHPLTKWTVGAGETLNALDRGIKIEQPESYYASVIVNGAGHGCCGALHAWTNPADGGTYYRSDLSSEAAESMGMPRLYPYVNATAGNGPFRFNFTLTVGQDHFDSYTVTYENANFDPVGPLAEMGELHISAGDGAKAQDDRLSNGDPVPVTNVTDTIEGMVWTDTGPKQAQYWIDDISFSINGTVVAADDFEDDPGASNDSENTAQGLGPYGPGTSIGDGFFPTSEVGTWMPNRYDVAKMAVPEPATLALMGLGGLMFARRRRA